MTLIEGVNFTISTEEIGLLGKVDPKLKGVKIEYVEGHAVNGVVVP